jgi:hypothetical protein
VVLISGHHTPNHPIFILQLIQLHFGHVVTGGAFLIVTTGTTVFVRWFQCMEEWRDERQGNIMAIPFEKPARPVLSGRNL